MKTLRSDNWKRGGFSVLWEPRALAGVVAPESVISMRQFFALRDAWPEDLPGSNGDALVVAGLDGCIDALSDADATIWLETDLRSAVLSFQSHYLEQAALILWLASGRTRVEMNLADQRYSWRVASSAGATLELGRCLWGGAENDVARILVSDQPSPDADGNAWVGLHTRRIS